jgi:hypothetical protein
VNTRDGGVESQVDTNESVSSVLMGVPGIDRRARFQGMSSLLCDYLSVGMYVYLISVSSLSIRVCS